MSEFRNDSAGLPRRAGGLRIALRARVRVFFRAGKTRTRAVAIGAAFLGCALTAVISTGLFAQSPDAPGPVRPSSGRPATNSPATNAAPSGAAGARGQFAEGKALFETICAACHGLTGAGLPPLAPPLTNSDWLLGREKRLVLILLQGLQGPVHVNGKTYEPPAVLPQMPSLGVMEDDQMAAVLNFVRNEWGRKARPIAVSEIAKARQETAKRELPWTEKELSLVKP